MKVNILTAHVLVSLKMGALCNADTTAMTAWRLFMSHNFWKEKSTQSCKSSSKCKHLWRIKPQRHVFDGCVYLGSADVKTQNLSSDLQRLCMEDFSNHPETCLDFKKRKKKNTHTHRLGHQASLKN